MMMIVIQLNFIGNCLKWKKIALKFNQIENYFINNKTLGVKANKWRKRAIHIKNDHLLRILFLYQKLISWFSFVSHFERCLFRFNMCLIAFVRCDKKFA